MISSRLISFNETAYQAHIYSLLEPTAVIIRGNQRRHHEVKKEYVIAKDPDTRTEAEKERAEDEYLKSKGVL